MNPLSFTEALNRANIIEKKNTDEGVSLIDRWESDEVGFRIVTEAPGDDSVQKFNPYHDKLGRFATSDGFEMMTISTKDPKKQHMADMAMERHKQRAAGGKAEEKKPERTMTDHRPETNVRPSFIAAELGVSKEKAEQMHNAVERYSGTAYVLIRAAQRGESDDPTFKKMGDDLEEFISMSPQWKGGELLRGINTSNQRLEGLVPGAVIDMGGSSSWSTKKSVAEEFSGHGNRNKVIFHLSNAGKATSITHISVFEKAEGEVLSSKDNQFKIRERTMVGDTTHVYLDLYQVLGKSFDDDGEFAIFKTDADKRLVFGWASIAKRADGSQLEDLQRDIIDPEDLEEAAYKYVLEFRDSGEEHIPYLRKKASLVESVMFTKEKMAAMGIPEGIVPEGWWVGFYVKDDAAWERIKNGTYKMFSIEGQAVREGVRETVDKSAGGCGVLVVKDGKILCGTRIERGGRGKICGPGGNIEQGEAPEDAAVREAMEEFGIKCESLLPLGELSVHGFKPSNIFLCTEFSGTPKTDEKEMTDPQWRTIDELEEADTFPPFGQSLQLLKEAVENEGPKVAKSFMDIIAKFNPFHDRLGRFATSDGFMTSNYSGDKSKQAVTFSANPDTKAGAMAIARHSNSDTGHEAIGGAFGTKTPAKNPKQKKPNPNNDPDTIAGVKRGEPMTREQANEGNTNPNFKNGPGYRINCQSCVVAFEARLRGFDVKTKPNTKGSKLEELSHDTRKAWIDPKTGKKPDFIINESVTTPKKCRTWLEETIKPGERYTIQHQWKGRSRSGHIVSIDRDTDGSLRLYDPQTGKNYKGADIDGYLKNCKYKMTVLGMSIPVGPKLLRVDNLQFNPDMVNHIMEAS